MKIRQLEAKNGDVSLHGRIAAENQPQQTLIVVSGGPGVSSEYMVDLEQLAGPDLAVVTYDPRGTGESSRVPATASSYSFDQYVADLEAVRQAVGAQQVDLLGHSWGGLVAMEYAIQYPQRVRSLILASSYPPTYQAYLEGMERHRRRIAQLQAEGLIMDPLPGGSVSLMDAVLPAAFSDPSFEFPYRDSYAPSHNYQASDYTWDAVSGYDLTDAIATLNQPVLLLWGEEDSFGIRAALVTKESLAYADVQFEILPNCGHFWHECPEVFFNLVRDFLDSNR